MKHFSKQFFKKSLNLGDNSYDLTVKCVTNNVMQPFKPFVQPFVHHVQYIRIHVIAKGPIQLENALPMIYTANTNRTINISLNQDFIEKRITGQENPCTS